MNIAPMPQAAASWPKLSKEAKALLPACEEGQYLGPATQLGARRVMSGEIALNYQESQRPAWTGRQFEPGETGVAQMEVFQKAGASVKDPAIVHMYYHSPCRFGLDAPGTSAQGKSILDGVYFVPDLSRVAVFAGKTVADKAGVEAQVRQTVASLDREAMARINQDSMGWGQMTTGYQYSTAMPGQGHTGRVLDSTGLDGDDNCYRVDRAKFDEAAASTLHYGLSQVMGLMPVTSTPQADGLSLTQRAAIGVGIGLTLAGAAWALASLL